MVRTSTLYVCQQCGFQSPQFLGRCPECGTWNSLVESVESVNDKVRTTTQIVNLTDVDKAQYQRLSTGIGEFDRVLGGGVVLGSVVLVAGEPGIGKSTLLTHLALNIAAGPARLAESKRAAPVSQVRPRSDVTSDHAVDARDLSSASPAAYPVLYISGEESAQQIKIRADRIKPKASLLVLNEVDVDVIVNAISDKKPKLAIVDSIQTLATLDLQSAAGSVGQVRESAYRLQRVAKNLHIPIILVGHITKEGVVAGPKTLEHIVDVVLSLEGDHQQYFRILRTTKNRFGSTDEVGVFEMKDTGLIEVDNPSKLFLAQKVDAPGSAVIVTLNGFRPILVEVQALVTKTNLPVPRRTGSGVDNMRLQLLVATLTKRMNLPLYMADIFVNLTGGIKVFEPAADLGICMAIISSLKDVVVPSGVAFVGEVGLLGELRSVRQIDKRVFEAKKLGFSRVISPENAKSLIEAVDKLWKRG